jgi:hypothetical protein
MTDIKSLMGQPDRVAWFRNRRTLVAMAPDRYRLTLRRESGALVWAVEELVVLHRYQWGSFVQTVIVHAGKAYTGFGFRAMGPLKEWSIIDLSEPWYPPSDPAYADSNVVRFERPGSAL